MSRLLAQSRVGVGKLGTRDMQCGVELKPRFANRCPPGEFLHQDGGLMPHRLAAGCTASLHVVGALR